MTRQFNVPARPAPFLAPGPASSRVFPAHSQPGSAQRAGALGFCPGPPGRAVGASFPCPRASSRESWEPARVLVGGRGSGASRDGGSARGLSGGGHCSPSLPPSPHAAGREAPSPASASCPPGSTSRRRPRTRACLLPRLQLRLRPAARQWWWGPLPSARGRPLASPTWR